MLASANASQPTPPSANTAQPRPSRPDAFWAALVRERGGPARPSAERQEVAAAAERQEVTFLFRPRGMDDIVSASSVDELLAAGTCVNRRSVARCGILAALGQFYAKWDRERYESFADPKGVITACVWAIFCQAVRPPLLAVIGASAAAAAKRAAAAHKAEMLEAHRKRAEKEQAEMLRLGGGDLAKGTERFVARMHEQKAEKYAKGSEGVALPLQEAFRAWWAGDDSKKWRLPMRDVAPAQFAAESRAALPAARTVYIASAAQMRAVLGALAGQPKAAACSVRATLKWDATVDPHSVPMAFVHPDDGLSPLRNHTRLVSPHTFAVVGVDDSGGRLCLVSAERLGGVYRLFPKEKGFEPFEASNPKLGASMRLLYQVACPILVIEATTAQGSLRVTLREGRGAAALSAEDLAELFADAATRAVDANIARLRAEKDARAAAARAAAAAPPAPAAPALSAAAREGLIQLVAKGLLSPAEFEKAVRAAPV